MNVVPCTLNLTDYSTLTTRQAAADLSFSV